MEHSRKFRVPNLVMCTVATLALFPFGETDVPLQEYFFATFRLTTNKLFLKIDNAASSFIIVVSKIH